MGFCVISKNWILSVGNRKIRCFLTVCTKPVSHTLESSAKAFLTHWNGQNPITCHRQIFYIELSTVGFQNTFKGPFRWLRLDVQKFLLFYSHVILRFSLCLADKLTPIFLAKNLNFKRWVSLRRWKQACQSENCEHFECMYWLQRLYRRGYSILLNRNLF